MRSGPAAQISPRGRGPAATPRQDTDRAAFDHPGTAAWRAQSAGGVWDTTTALDGITSWERNLATWDITDMVQAELFETFDYNFTYVSATLQVRAASEPAISPPLSAHLRTP